LKPSLQLRPSLQLSACRWHRWTRAFAATDPGLVRLRSASATTLTLVLALAVLYPLSVVLGQSLPMALLGTVVATFAASVVRDQENCDRIITTILVPLPAVASASLATVLNGYGVVADAGFIVVLFIATWVRRFGPRGTALGMVAFTAYSSCCFCTLSCTSCPGCCSASPWERRWRCWCGPCCCPTVLESC